MNKKHYLFIVLNLVFLTGWSQTPITLTAPNLSQLVQEDTFYYVGEEAKYNDIAKPEKNHSWDLTKATYGDGITTEIENNTSADFSSAEYSGSYLRQFGASLYYTIDIYTEANASAFEHIGEAILTDQVIPLQGSTGNPNDQLVFPKQMVPYVGTEIVRKFPSTMNDNWKSELTHENKFNITIAAFGLSKTPGVYKTRRVTTDSVVGWGTMKIKHAKSGNISNNIEVLQVRRTLTRTDSFYLGGALAPKALLDAFGLVQGGVVSKYLCYFYRVGELKPLVEVDYGASQFKTVESMEVHQDNFEDQNSGLETMNLQNIIRVYPNPVKNKLTVNLPNGNSNDWSFKLSNLQGQTILQNTFNDENTFYLNSMVQNGLYLFEIIHKGKTTSVSRISVNN